MKTLVIDGQVFQSIARHRGMGRYSEYLVDAITRRSDYDQVYVVYSANNRAATDINVEAKTAFLDLKDANDGDIETIEGHNKNVVNDFIKSLGIPSKDLDYLLLAAFQEPIVSVFPDNSKKHMIFYDLIPYLYPEQYMDKMPFDKYLRHFRQVFEADKLLAISHTAADELSVFLGIPRDKVIAIDGAPIRSAAKPRKPAGVTLPKRYILMPTGDDPRKNNYRAVEGFEKYLSKRDIKISLVITSDIHPAERAKLEKLSKNLIFTGNVDESELDWMYAHAEMILFVSESEGLGLPILEAMHASKPVVASQLDVFREISETALYYCDQKDTEDIARAIDEAIGSSITNDQRAEYKRALVHYTWPETAKRSIKAMVSTEYTAPSTKQRIAVFSPRPDGISAIGKVVAETHASLQRMYDVDYYIENGSAAVSTRPDYLKYVANCYPASAFSVEAYTKYDAVFYHIGNSDYHLASIANSLYLPGYVIIHDTNISDAFREMMEQGMISKDRRDLEAKLTNIRKLKMSNHLVSVITNQLGVMSHSDYADRAVREIVGTIHTVPSFSAKLPTVVPAKMPLRRRNSLNIGMAGIIADIKGTAVIESLAQEKSHVKNQFHIFGYNYSHPDTMKRLESYHNVELATNVTDFDFIQRMRKLDIFVNYRMQYQGETSLSTLEAMRQGVVVVVRNIGWYSELPDDTVVKVDSIEEVSAVVDRLSKHPELITAISDRAVEYIRKEYTHDLYVQSMQRMIEIASEGMTKSEQQTVAGLLQNNKIKSAQQLVEKRIT